MLGYSLAEFLGKKLWEVGPFADIAQCKEMFKELQINGYARYEDLPLRTITGTIKDVEFVSNSYDCEGIKVIQCNIRDITERKLIEQKLRESEQRYRYLFNEAEVAMFRLRKDGSETIDCNDKFLEIFGYTREEVIGSPSAEYWKNPLDREEMIRRLVAEGRVTDYEIEVFNKRGELLHCVTSMRLSKEEGLLEGSIQDITGRKQAETELRIAAIAFEAQEGILVSDTEGIIVRVNHAFTEITGYAPEEVVGRKTSLLKSGRHDASFYANLWETLKKNGSWQGEIWNRRKNGEVYPEWLSIKAVRGEGMGVTHYVATQTDITLRKAAEDEIKYLAFYDALTRLPNRRMLDDRMRQALAASTRSGRIGALMFIDLDKFKTLNDAFGHEAGDQLLQQVGERLVTCVREGDTVARLGGDEFVVMLENLSADVLEATAQVSGVGAKILATCDRPYLIAGHEQRSTSSIGVTLFGHHKDSLGELLKQADIAMYEAKAAGRHTIRFYSPDIRPG